MHLVSPMLKLGTVNWVTHCNFGAIIDMARKHTIKGIAINLSSSPAKCDACIRGIQTCTLVSEVRKGEKAKCVVFISLFSVAEASP